MLGLWVGQGVPVRLQAEGDGARCVVHVAGKKVVPRAVLLPA
jgi:hypothetical protein